MVTNTNGKTIEIKMAQRDIDDLKLDVRDLHKKFDDRNQDVDQWLDEKFSEVFTAIGFLREDKAKLVGMALGIGGVGTLVGLAATLIALLGGIN